MHQDKNENGINFAKLQSNNTNIKKAHIKLAVLLSQTQTSSFLPKAIINFIEHAQIYFQTLYLTSRFMDDTPLTEFELYKALNYISKFINFSYLFSYQTYKNLVSTILYIVAILILFKSFLWYYFLIKVMTNKDKASPYLLNCCTWISRLQTRVLYFFFSSFWVRTLSLTIQYSFTITGTSKVGTIILSIIMILWETLLTVHVQSVSFNSLPQRDPFCSRDKSVEIINLVHKVLSQVAQILYLLNREIIIWIIVIGNILVSITRAYIYKVYLPLYNVQALLYNGRLLMALCAFDIITFIRLILYTSKDKNDSVLLIPWILLTILMIFVYNNYLQKQCVKLITDDQFSGPPELMVQKIEIIKQLQKRRGVTNSGSHSVYNFYDLLYRSAVRSLQQYINPTLNNNLFTTKSEHPEEDLLELEKQYLEDLVRKHPKNEFLKLYLAFFYTKKLKQHKVAMKTLEHLRKNCSFKSLQMSDFIVNKIECLVVGNYKKQDNVINLYEYVNNQLLMSKLKVTMSDQVKLQLNLYKEITSINPNLGQILIWSKKIDKVKKNVEIKIKELLNKVPHFWPSLYLMVVSYYKNLNFDLVEAQRYSKSYITQYPQYQKHFELNTIVPENAYQEKNAFSLFSNSDKLDRTILFCSNSISVVYGGTARGYIGKKSSIFRVPYMTNVLQKHIATHKPVASSLMTQNVMYKGLGYHKDGYLIPIEAHSNIYPYISEGDYNFLLVRRLEPECEYLVVNEYGDILHATKNLSEQLGLHRSKRYNKPPKSIHISELSEKLVRINEAMNLLIYNKDSNSGSTLR